MERASRFSQIHVIAVASLTRRRSKSGLPLLPQQHPMARSEAGPIPYESVLEQLQYVTGIDSSDIGSHMREAFGDKASIKFHSSEAQEEEAEEDDLSGSVRPDAGILLSGCQANETSADMSPGEEGGKAYGAFTNAIQMVLNSHERPISNREVVTWARKLLHEDDFEQHPCLFCSDENADAPFLWQPEY